MSSEFGQLPYYLGIQAPLEELRSWWRRVLLTTMIELDHEVDFAVACRYNTHDGT